jgi:hypothetical protein
VIGSRALVLGLRFLCELGMLAALAYWGSQQSDGALALVLAIAAPLVAATLWGVFVAPKSLVKLPVQTRLIVEFFLFGFAALALADAGQAALAVALGAVAFGTSLLTASQERVASD